MLQEETQEKAVDTEWLYFIWFLERGFIICTPSVEITGMTTQTKWQAVVRAVDVCVQVCVYCAWVVEGPEINAICLSPSVSVLLFQGRVSH